MNAPCPPPTIPSRIRPPCNSVAFDPSIVIALLPRRLSDAKHPIDLILVDLSSGKIVERFLRYLDDVFCNEGRALVCTLLGVLQAAFPLEHRPAIVVIGGKLREDRSEIDLSVAQRSEAAGTLDPWLIAGIDARLPSGLNSASFT